MALPRPTRPASADREASSTSRERLDRKQLRPSDMFRFDPKPDITVTELAQLIAAFFEIDMHFDRFLNFPEPLQRHFRRIKTG